MLPINSINHKAAVVTLFYMLMLIVSSVGHAGLVSSLLKAGRKADAPEIKAHKHTDLDLNTAGLDLPDGTKVDLISAKVDANGDWQLKQADGHVLASVDGLKNPAVVINSPDLPKDLSKLRTLPNDVPLIVRHRNKAYRWKSKPPRLYNGNASIPVKHSADLQKALFHFGSSWKGGKIRIVGLEEAVKNSARLQTGVASKTVVNSPQFFKGQTLVISGPVKNGKIDVGGKKLSLDQLVKDSAAHDFSLVVLETSTKVSPSVTKQLIDTVAPNGQATTTGDFLAAITPKNNQITTYEITDANQRQVLLSLKPSDQPHTELRIEDVVVETTANVAFLGVRIYQRNQSRQEAYEKENRPKPSVYVYVLMYLIASSLAGLSVFGSCRQFIRRFWPTRVKASFSHYASYLGFKALRLALLVFLVLPLLGLPIGIWHLFHTLYIAVKILLMPFLSLARRLIQLSKVLFRI